MKRIACCLVLAACAVASPARAQLFTTAPTLTCFLQNNVTGKLARTVTKDMTTLIADAISVDPSIAATVTVVFNSITGKLEIVHRCEGDTVFSFATPRYCSTQSSPTSQKEVCSFDFAAGGTALCQISLAAHGAKVSASGSCVGPIEFVSTLLPCQLQLKVGKPFVPESCP